MWVAVSVRHGPRCLLPGSDLCTLTEPKQLSLVDHFRLYIRTYTFSPKHFLDTSLKDKDAFRLPWTSHSGAVQTPSLPQPFQQGNLQL